MLYLYVTHLTSEKFHMKEICEIFKSYFQRAFELSNLKKPLHNIHSGLQSSHERKI